MILSFKIVKGIFCITNFFFLNFDAYLWIDQNISWHFSIRGSYFIYMGSYQIATLIQTHKKEEKQTKINK